VYTLFLSHPLSGCQPPCLLSTHLPLPPFCALLVTVAFRWAARSPPSFALYSTSPFYSSIPPSRLVLLLTFQLNFHKIVSQARFSSPAHPDPRLARDTPARALWHLPHLGANSVAQQFFPPPYGTFHMLSLWALQTIPPPPPPPWFFSLRFPLSYGLPACPPYLSSSSLFSRCGL